MPTPGTGLGSFAAFITESVYGNDPGSGYKYHRIVKSSWLPTAEYTRGNRGLGRLGVSSLRNRVKHVEGSVTIDNQYEGDEVLLLHFFGGTDTFSLNNPVSGTHTHIFSPSTTRKVGLTYHDNLVVSRAAINGVKLNKMEWKITNENLETTFGGVGKVHAEAACDTPTFPTAPDVLALDGTAPAGLVAKLDTVAFNIREASISADFPYTTDREYLGFDAMQEPLPQDVMSLTGELTREYEDTTYSSKWIANTKGQLDFDYQSGAYITGTTRYKYAITLFEVVFGSARAPVESGGVLVEKIPFKAHINSAGQFFQVAKINAIGTAVT